MHQKFLSVVDVPPVLYSQLRAPMMTTLLRKLVVDVPALTENTVVPLRVSRIALNFLFHIIYLLN